ncbi:MAG: putative enzyme of poly-gamma-glutamate biosynthesis (capsule formation) [Parcubacteria group bacterium Gr01-1014_8]|nr:MAG: putative enzyme of poly-gamma-glutamate biosynthesis (capsule formation) [Parcubacteria group bacterium Gr01-1014_8]
MVLFFLSILMFGSLLPLPAEAPHAVFFSLLPAKKDAQILFGGDMMFDRSVRETMRENGDDHVFSCIRETLLSSDVVVANLEGPITTHSSLSLGSKVDTPENVTFTFSTSTATLLKRHNMSLVNIGNNHIMNFSREGLLQTKKWLDGAGIQYFGDPDSTESDRVARLEINGIPFSFVNWSDWTPVRKLSASNGAGELNPVVEQVRTEAESKRVVVVYAHWGEEYVPPTKPMRQLAHSFVDAGAEIVIGSHPHIVQEHELYNGKDIYYSLGNFVFDQYWNDEVSTGLLLRVTFDKDGVQSIAEIPVKLSRDKRVCVIE